jgi:chromosome segregation protein
VATLQSIELAGFKSFAKRTKIEFSNGLVAIVGPNGSGKSNITDAIRWVFGEQKTRSLRSDKSEDLIYHGGDGKSRASMAEVIIRLDNSARAIPIELNEIEITRRLYRSGESNYLLNGRRASLSSIQEVLAASGFGVGSYTVIGQGMVDRLILSSGKERKQLFEEASGIKQYEIKHTQTLKRILSTQENLDQIKILIAELQPKNDMLKRQADLLERRNKLKHDLEHKKSSYIISNSELLDKLILENKNEITKISLELKALDKEIHRIEKENEKTKNSDVKKSLDSVNIALAKLESQKAELEEEIGSMNISVEKLRSDANELDQIIEMSKAEQGSLNENLKEHLKNQKQIEKIVSNFDSKLLKIDNKILVQTKELDRARKELVGSQKSEYLKHSLGLIDILQDGIRREKSEQDLAIVFYKLRRMIKHSMADNSAELAMKVGKIQNLIARLMDEREKINDSQTNEVIRLRAIEMDSSSIESKIMDLEAKIQQSQKLKSSILSKGNLSKLELKIAKFELQKAELNLSISHKRDELVEIAKQGAQDEIDEYYSEHEKLTNQRVALNSQLESLLNTKTNLADQASEIQATKNLWFPYKMPAPPKIIQISKEEINKLEAEMSLLEEINPEVEKEVQESQKQLNYLSAQANDLKKAVDNLNKVATDTENKIKSVFEKGFDKINSNFTKNFKELFGGGEAELKLSRTNEDYGVEIFVKLPNKNAQNISSLSGGEKALASMALLCGILMSNPSPFVVLDEVDAALDEENTKRFAGIISKITKHSQVLVVTHNHDTMAVADELLGVTTGGNNESSIIKVRLGSVPLEVSK